MDSASCQARARECSDISKAALFKPFFKIALRQDQRILNIARANKLPDSKPVVGRLDVLRPHIEAILRGERPTVADAPVEIMMEL